VVAVESGAVAEIIKNQGNGILTSNNPAEIAIQVLALFSNSPRSLGVRQFPIDSSSPSLDAKAMLTDHISLYVEILSTNR
jgi:hypothetical protein